MTTPTPSMQLHLWNDPSGGRYRDPTSIGIPLFGGKATGSSSPKMGASWCVDTHTSYPNGSNYQRLNPAGRPKSGFQLSREPHGHGHLRGPGPNPDKGQRPSIAPDFNSAGNQKHQVPSKSKEAHWPIKR